MSEDGDGQGEKKKLLARALFYIVELWSFHGPEEMEEEETEEKKRNYGYASDKIPRCTT